MIKVAIIGCGKIADAHVEQIERMPNCEIVGVCDKEELMAKQLFERFRVKKYFSDINELLELAKPNIVHVTTPPQSHFEIGMKCLEAGCHVYIEKPFTINTEEAEKLIKIAEEKKLRITVGHDEQFTYATRRMRELIRKGYLGGDPVHMESYYCYDLGNERYAKSFLGDKNHWVRKLPGKLLHNNISHGICRIAEYLRSECPIIIAHGFTSGFLRNIAGDDIIDELRVIIYDERTTAYFTFSSQMRPTLRHFRVYGTKNALMVDHDHQTLIKIRGARFKSYLDKFIPPCDFAKQYMENSLINVNRFLKRDFHMKSGMKYLIESFYRSVAYSTPLPIPYREIILTSKIMDSIFMQLGKKVFDR